MSDKLQFVDLATYGAAWKATGHVAKNIDKLKFVG